MFTLIGYVIDFTIHKKIGQISLMQMKKTWAKAIENIDKQKGLFITLC